MTDQKFNICIVAQSGRLQYEAILFLTSFYNANPSFKGRVFVAQPKAGPNWSKSPEISNDDVKALYETLGAEIVTFDTPFFGESYPYGNKIEALKALPKGEPFVFFDTDTVVLDDITKVPFDFNKPSASNRVCGTWPNLELYGPGYNATWGGLYQKFGLDFESSLDMSQPDEYWRRYLYFNAGYFFYRCPHEFGARFTEYAVAIRDTPPPELVCQTLDPWLDQVALPLVIHSFGGGRNTIPTGLLDGSVTCHYRVLPLMYARENDHVIQTVENCLAPNKIKKVAKQYEPFKRMVFQGRGAKVRALFDQNDLPRKEQKIRNMIKREGFWMR